MVLPVWCREAISYPPKLLQRFPPASKPAVFNFEQCMVDLSLEHLNLRRTGSCRSTVRGCSSLDILSVKVWQCRTQAIDPEYDTDVTLIPFTDALPFLHHVLPARGATTGTASKIKSSTARTANAALLRV